MKKGRWVGSLLLCMGACIAELHGEDVQWQAVGDAPRTDVVSTPTLAAPVPLTSTSPRSAGVPPAPLPGIAASGLMPVSYETPIPAEPPPLRHSAEIIAVSAPVTPPETPTTEEQEEPIDSLFAADRPFSLTSSKNAAGGGIVRTSANVVVPDVATGAGSEVPMIPGWGAPVDASWGVGVPTGPLPQDPDIAAIPAFNPLTPRVYASAEYLLWWLQGQSVPVLGTTSAFSNSPQEASLADPSTTILFGGNRINGNSPFSGGRFTVGYWLGCDPTKGVEFTGFFLGTRSAGFMTNSSMNPVIGRPFQEANNGQETAQLTSQPGVTAGTLTINAPTSLWGLAGNLRCQLCCGCNYRITLLAGFRNLNLDESLSITENVIGLPTAPAPFANQLITVTDRFATQNNFYGGNLGADARWYWGRWSIDVRGQVALGDTVQILDINGSQHIVPGVPTAAGLQQNFTGGLLALNSNIGHFTHNAFSVVPEIGVNLGYQILPNLRGYVGYNFLYWSNVIRPATSIDRVLDVTRIPNFPVNPEPPPVPGLHPAPFFHEVGLWAQGLTFGLEFVY